MNSMVLKKAIINPDVIKMIVLEETYLNNKNKMTPTNRQIRPKLDMNAIRGNAHSGTDSAMGTNSRQGEAINRVIKILMQIKKKKIEQCSLAFIIL